MSGAMARYPAAASASNWCRHEYQHSGKPWQRSTVGPLPASARCIRMPFDSINRCEIVIANLRKIIDLLANQSHCELPATTEVARPTRSRTADRQNDMLYEFIFEPAPRLRQHRRKLGFGSIATTPFRHSCPNLPAADDHGIRGPPDWPPTPAERALDSAHISPVQLIGEVRQPIPAEPGQLERYDCEYHRNGTVNLFVCIDVHRPWRKVKVTERRAAEDYAHCMRELVDVHYPDAACIRVVQDNLSTHSAGALYEAFPPAEARRILRRLEFHYTPKHASWLNMVEIEIGVLRGQCLDRRIDDSNWLRQEIDAWERQRNAAAARIKWMFTTDKARAKMGRAYPVTSKES